MTRRSTTQSLTWLAALLILLAQPALAAELVVDRINGPYFLISEAIAAAFSGDTIRVAAGCYGTLNCPGGVDDPVVIDKALSLLGAGPNGPAPGSSISPVSGHGVTVLSGITGVTIAGFSIRSPTGDGINVGTSAEVHILNNVIQLSADTGIQGTTGGTFVIQNNVILNNTSHGIDTYISSTWATAIIENNIIMDNGGWGVEGSGTNGSCQNNDVYNNASGAVSGAWCSSGNNLTSILPGFANQAEGNFTLSPTSPLIDAGLNLALYRDPDGSPSDVGAFGGPGAADFWPYTPSGPVIESLTITPSSVSQGDSITIRATGRIRTPAP